MQIGKSAVLYGGRKTSPGVRTLEDIKNEMGVWKNSVDSLRQEVKDYEDGWDFDSDDPVKGEQLKKRLKTAEDTYAKLEKEYESHPDYYTEKYAGMSGFEKATTGILGSTIATVPVIAETAAAAVGEAHRKMESDEYMAALQAEQIAKNKMNDYASGMFGSFDMIDPNELERLKQEYQTAVDYRKSLEEQYKQPVDMDSWGMRLMNESAWLKDSATENLNGFWKTAADAAIDVGQGAALLPLMAAGPGAYTAGMAANAAAEDMYEQTAKGKAASDAMGSGILTAGVEVATDKISSIKNDAWKGAAKDILSDAWELGKKALKPDKKVTAKQVWETIKGNKETANVLLEGMKLGAGKEGAIYLMNYLADKLARDPEAEFNLREFLQSATANKGSGTVSDTGENIAKEIEWFWNTLG